MDQPFFLSGDFNDWSPASPAHRLQEVVSPYGPDSWGGRHPRRRLRLGSYHLTLDLPPGTVRFKLLEGGGWGRQWTTMPFHGEEQPFAAHRFHTRCGVEGGVVVPRGGGRPPHVEVEVPGGPVRFDFQPEARWLAVHGELERSPGPVVRPWRRLRCGDAEYHTWLSLPYGYREEGFRYPLLLVFDGRELVHGEDPRQGRFHVEGRQLPRSLDLLARHGVIPPAVVVGVEVPRRGGAPVDWEPWAADRRDALFAEDSALHRAYRDSLLEELLPAAREELPLREDLAWVAGHSWGADFALRLLAAAPERLGGALALSPSRPLARLADLRPQPHGPRVAVVYGRHDLGPFFLTEAARSGELLREAGIPGLVQLARESSHEPHTLRDQVPAALAFALG